MTGREVQPHAQSPSERFAQWMARLAQPEDMKTGHYQYGVETVDGNRAWALFCASGAGDLERVRAILDRDPRLVNAQHWYQFPIHMAVREGHAEVVELLLQAGADPGQSRYTYNSWDKLLAISEEREYGEVQALLAAAMRERFGYDPGFAALAGAIKGRDRDRVEAVPGEHPGFIRAADALGNGPLHWAALTRQNDLVDLFAARGAGLETRRADGQTPLLVSLNGDYWYRTRDLPEEAPQGLVDGHPSPARLRCGVRPEHRLRGRRRSPRRCRAGGRSRPGPRPRCRQTESRSPTPPATAIPGSWRNCWTWVPIPTGRRSSHRAAEASSGHARETTWRRRS